MLVNSRRKEKKRAESAARVMEGGRLGLCLPGGVGQKNGGWWRFRDLHAAPACMHAACISARAFIFPIFFVCAVSRFFLSRRLYAPHPFIYLYDCCRRLSDGPVEFFWERKSASW